MIRLAIHAFVCAVFLALPARADWLANLGLLRTTGVETAVRSDAEALDQLATLVTAATSTGGAQPVLGAHVSQEGHWTLLNAAGERLTAANPEEMRRILPLLTGRGDDVRPRMILSAVSVFRDRRDLALMPPTSHLSLAQNAATLPLVRRGDVLLAEVRRGLLVEIGERRSFEEAIFQLARPLGRSRLRVVSLAPDGPETLQRQPPFDGTGKPAADVIDAYKLPKALRTLTGQTVVVTGRLDRERLVFRTPAGTEQAILLPDLISAAARHDVDLVLLKTTSARQPGTRNWLWQRIEVAGLDKPREHPTMADFLDALAGSDGNAPIVVRVAGVDGSRVRLSLSRDGSGTVGGLFSDLTAGVTGRLGGTEAAAWMVGSERHHELSRRIVPGVPAAAQHIYLALLLAGLLGLPAAYRWWTALWPPERRDEYAAAAGWHAARLVKLLAFGVLFLPLAAPLALIWTLARAALAIVALPIRFAFRPRLRSDRHIEGRPT